MKNKLYIILAAFFFTVTVLFLPIILNYGKTGQNTYVLGKNYSGLTQDEIYQRLKTDFSLPKSISLKSDIKDYTLNLSTISASIDDKKMASSLLYRRLNEGIIHYIQYFFAPKKFTLTIKYDQSSFDNFVDNLQSQVNQPFVPVELVVTSNPNKQITVSVKNGQLGLTLNSAKLQQQLINNLSSGDFDSSINLPLDVIGNLPSAGQITQTEGKAKKLIGKSLILTSFDNSQINIDDKTLISWLNFDDQYNQPKIGEYIKTLSQSLNRAPIDSVFKFDNGKVTEFTPAENGKTVQQDELNSSITGAIDQLISVVDFKNTLPISFTDTAPNIKTGDVNNLGIKELLGRGTSTFNHSNQTRNFNIEKGAAIVNRILVPPGETFSFIKNLGEVTLETGFKKAYIIRQGKTELDVGGGICQVSTTMFRAMLDAGVDITDRHPHAYRVSYYEEDSLPGYDATVFIPNPDLKFVNDTGYHILIQNIFDIKNKRLTYEIYGTSDGRKVAITNYRRWDASPAPPARYIDDPTLPLGKTIQDEHAVPGLKTAFDWKVTRNDQVLHQQTFTSSYVPWAAVYRRGTMQP